mgnify:CR=1 FL=1
MAVSKALFLEVHTEVAKWRWLVLHWFRQLLRDHAPFDVARRLHYEMVFPLVTYVGVAPFETAVNQWGRYQWDIRNGFDYWFGWKQMGPLTPR